MFHRVFDGSAGEVGQVIPVMKALQQMTTERRLLIIGDSKLISMRTWPPWTARA